MKYILAGKNIAANRFYYLS